MPDPVSLGGPTTTEQPAVKYAPVPWFGPLCIGTVLCPYCEIGKELARYGEDGNSRSYRVVGVSDSPNSFGLRGHVVVAETGEAWELGLNEINSKKVGTDIKTRVVCGEPTWAGLGVEIPRKMAPAPLAVISAAYGNRTKPAEGLGDPPRYWVRLQTLAEARTGAVLVGCNWLVTTGYDAQRYVAFTKGMAPYAYPHTRGALADKLAVKLRAQPEFVPTAFIDSALAFIKTQKRPSDLP